MQPNVTAKCKHYRWSHKCDAEWKPPMTNHQTPPELTRHIREIEYLLEHYRDIYNSETEEVNQSDELDRIEALEAALEALRRSTPPSVPIDEMVEAFYGALSELGCHAAIGTLAKKDVIHALTAALAVQPSVPQGWKLVPEEPTLEMLDALDPCCDYQIGMDDNYKAMLDVAPALAVQPRSGCCTNLPAPKATARRR